MRIVLVIIDTLRPDHLGCYGNDWIRTPSFDALALDSVMFTRAYPECLPTLPARRAIHTGTRIFPFHGHGSQKGDFKGAPGWGPMMEEKDALAELLQAGGYRTALVADTYHQFKASKNFHRGFEEWHWVRGQETDAYRRGPVPSKEAIHKHLPPDLRTEGRIVFHEKYLANVSERKYEEDYFPARVFSEAARCFERNLDADDFFLVIDSFDPHEPWDPPAHYRDLYDEGDPPDYDIICSIYGPANQMTPRQLKRVQANYAGEVTMVDHWLGYFWERVQATGAADETLLMVVSDHGHCVGEQGLVGKQGHPMSREIADLALLMRFPDGKGAGTTCDAFVQHHDITATILAQAGVSPHQPIDGQDFTAVALDNAEPFRQHVTTAWGSFVMVRDDRYWYNAYLWGNEPLLYDLVHDPKLTKNIAADHEDVCKWMNGLALEDAGGDYPEFLRTMAEAGEPGCTPIRGA